MAKAKKVAKKAPKKKPVVKAKAKLKVKPAVAKKPAKKVAKEKAAPKGKTPKVVAKVAPQKVAKVVEKPMPVALEAKPKGKAKSPDAKRPEVAVEVEATEPQPVEEIILTDAEGRRYCRVKDCDQLSTVDAYCRYHYLLYWKRIQVRKKILTEGKLERYIEELTARYPDKFLDMLRKDLRSEKEFLAAIQELEIDESQTDGEFEDENENIIDEVRGISEPAAREEEEF